MNQAIEDLNFFHNRTYCAYCGVSEDDELPNKFYKQNPPICKDCKVLYEQLKITPSNSENK